MAVAPAGVAARTYLCHFLLLRRTMLAGPAPLSALKCRCCGVATVPWDPALCLAAAAAAGDAGSVAWPAAVPPAAGLRHVREPRAAALTAVRRRLLPLRPPFLYTSTRCCCWPSEEEARIATVDLPARAAAEVECCDAASRAAALEGAVANFDGAAAAGSGPAAEKALAAGAGCRVHLLLRRLSGCEGPADCAPRAAGWGLALAAAAIGLAKAAPLAFCGWLTAPVDGCESGSS